MVKSLNGFNVSNREERICHHDNLEVPFQIYYNYTIGKYRSPHEWHIFEEINMELKKLSLDGPKSQLKRG